MHAGAVAAVDLRGPVGGDFHPCENLPGKLAAADRVECDRRAGLHQRIGQLVHEAGRG